MNSREFTLFLSSAYSKQFSKELGLTRSCTDSELHRAMDEATRLYDLRVKTASNSDPNAFSESELKMAVEEVLRQRKLKAGEYAHVPESQYTQEQWQRAMDSGAVVVPDKFDLAEQAIPEVEDVGDAEQRGEKLTFQQQSNNSNHGPVSNVFSSPMALQSLHQPIAHACSSLHNLRFYFQD